MIMFNCRGIVFIMMELIYNQWIGLIFTLKQSSLAFRSLD